MTTLLTVMAIVAGYLATGAVYARCQAVACHRRAKQAWSSDAHVRESVRLQQVWRVFAWPYAVVFDAIRGAVAAWFAAPLTARRQQATELRAQADSYDRLIADCDDPTDRELMRRGQNALRTQAREVDL